MPPQDYKVGPWMGGLNTRISNYDVEDDEVTEASNVEFDDHGTVRARRRLYDTHIAPPMVSVGALLSLGFYYPLVNTPQTAVLASTWSWLNQSGVPQAVSGAGTVLANTSLGNWQYLTYCHYGNQLFFPNAKVGGRSGFHWTGDPLTGAIVETLDATMPNGNASFIWKERMWLYSNNTRDYSVGSSRVYYSKVTDPSFWTTPTGGYFDVGLGDGDNITSILLVANSLYIFKQSSTYVFRFGVDPALDGTLEKISGTSGADAAVLVNNEIYIINKASVFKFVNNNFYDIGDKLDFNPINTTTLFPTINAFDDFLIAGPDSAQDFYYVYNVRIRAWSRWGKVGQNWSGTAFNEISRIGGFDSYSILSSLYRYSHNHNLVSINCGYDVPGGVNTPFPILFQTKYYTLNNNTRWKRLFKVQIDGDISIDQTSGAGTPVLTITVMDSGSANVSNQINSGISGIIAKRIGAILTCRVRHFGIKIATSYTGTVVGIPRVRIRSLTYKVGIRGERSVSV